VVADGVDDDRAAVGGGVDELLGRAEGGGCGWAGRDVEAVARLAGAGVGAGRSGQPQRDDAAGRCAGQPGEDGVAVGRRQYLGW
jgi:hypothetical protein